MAENYTHHPCLVGQFLHFRGVLERLPRLPGKPMGWAGVAYAFQTLGALRFCENFSQLSLFFAWLTVMQVHCSHFVLVSIKS